MNSQKKYSLWIPGWFPSKESPLNGDFIHRHAIAVSLYVPIIVLYVVKNTQNAKKEKEIIVENNLTIIRLYYPQKSNIKFIEKFLSAFFYTVYSLAEFYTIYKKNGKPENIHVHIAQKSLVTGWLFSRLAKNPFILSEHSSKFLENGESSYFKRSAFTRFILNYLLRKTDNISVVSNVLAKSIEKFSGLKKITVIPNVVDTNIFSPIEKKTIQTGFHFIHISNLTPHKNPHDIIQAFEMVNKTSSIPIFLTLVGPKIMKDKFITDLNKSFISYIDELPQTELAKEIQKSDAFILYSNYETFGCVVIEALACGKPVILADTPISREIIEEGKHGLLAIPQNPKELANVIIDLIESINKYEPLALAAHIKKTYSFQAVGKQFAEMYTELSNP